MKKMDTWFSRFTDTECPKRCVPLKEELPIRGNYFPLYGSFNVDCSTPTPLNYNFILEYNFFFFNFVVNLNL